MIFAPLSRLGRMASMSLMVLWVAPLFPQSKQLSFDQVFLRSEPRLTAPLPQIRGWLDDDHYMELRTEKNQSQLLKVRAANGAETVYLDFEALYTMLPKGVRLEYAPHTEDFSRFITVQQNDLYLVDVKTKQYRQITAAAGEEKNPQFSPSGQLVAFTRNHDLYVVDTATGLERQLTSDGSDTIYNGWASWVYYEEILGRASRYAAFWWSPNSEMIAFLRFDDSQVPVFSLFRADGIHGEIEQARYPKPGDPNPKVRLGIAFVKTRQIVWVQPDENVDDYIAWPFWTPDSKRLCYQWLNRGQDHLKIYAADPLTGTKIEIYSEQQPSWIEFYSDLTFFQDGSGFLLRSDRDGWSHLYHYDLNGNLKAQLTSGSWNVKEIVRVDQKNKIIFFHGTGEKSADTYLYRVRQNGQGLTRLTPQSATHNAMVSPTGKYFINSYSTVTMPTKMAIYNGDGKVLRGLGDQKTTAMDEYQFGTVELFTIPSGDGYELPAVWILPPSLDRQKKYPVIFSVYGGPGSATVQNAFRGFAGHYFAQNGIIYLSVDNRGSGHFGKKGMAEMHRSLGKWEMHDLIAAVKWLREQPFIDKDRIGITGGSYGGYTTCMALTYGADFFTHGVADFSVTDWRLYDSVYTERYMDTPDENPEGYREGSTLTHADKYKGTLLLTHGTMDDNVHMQNTIQLVDRLTDLNKDFELMLYPNGRHGIGFPKAKHQQRERVQFWFRHFLNKEF